MKTGYTTFGPLNEALKRIAELEAERDAHLNRQQDGNNWASATFGPATIKSTMHRIDQEMREFYEDPVHEARDIAIFLYRLASVAGFDLDSEVDRKMEINKSRTWVLSGDGCGQHTGSVAKKGVMEELLELRAENALLRKALEGAEILKRHLFNCPGKDDGIDCECGLESIEAALARIPEAPK